MTSKIFFTFLLFVFGNTVHAIQKRVIEPNREAQDFQKTIFQVLEHYEPQSESITLEIGRRSRTYTLAVQFENPGESNALLEERIQCRQEFGAEESIQQYFCRFEIFNQDYDIGAFFYNEGVSHILSDALHSAYRQMGRQGERFYASTSGEDSRTVWAQGLGNQVGCRVHPSRSFYYCYFFINRIPDAEVTMETFEDIRAREPWLNDLEESFLLNDLELQSVNLRIRFRGWFILTAVYAPSGSSDQRGKRLRLEGVYEGSNFIETSRYTRLEIIDI